MSNQDRSSSAHRNGESHATPPVNIEMCGPNLVIRSTTFVDAGFTAALVEAVNAAASADTTVIIDPEPIRCSDEFAATADTARNSNCTRHHGCEPVRVEAVNSTMIRIATERNSWLVDLPNGRMCEADPRTNIRHLAPGSWMPVIAVRVTPTRLTALTANGTFVSVNRAHRVNPTPT